MIVVLEGTEAVGKTTLAEELRSAWGDLAPDGGVTFLRHTGPPDLSRPTYPQYAEPLFDERFRATALDPDCLIILDRFHLGCLIYGPLLRGVSDLTDVQLSHLELTLKGLGAFTVVVSAKEDEIRERMGPHREDLVDVDTAVKLNKEYLDLAGRLRWPVVNPTAYRPGELARSIIGKARVLTAGAQHLYDHPGYVGSPAPMMLFVGDQPSGWRAGRPITPAFYPGTAASSASYLLRALESAQANVAYGLCNANDGTNVGALWETLHRPIVAGLGRRAQQTLNRLGLTFVEHPHPQFMRRFHHQEALNYGRDLFFGESIRNTA